MASKLVVTSMSLLALISSPTWALSKYQLGLSEIRQRIGNLQVIQDVPRTCPIDQSFILMKDMTQNAGRAFANRCSPGWFYRFGISGGVNVDLGKFGNRNANFMGENYQVVTINDAYLNITTTVNDWVLVFMSLNYNNATTNNPLSSTTFHHVAEYDAAYSRNMRFGAANKFVIEQAFLTIANFEESPLFVQVGNFYQDYGRYQIHPITEPVTQVMTKILHGAAKIGFLYQGFTGSFYAFNSPIPKVNHTSASTDYGLSLGYSYQGSPCVAGWDIGMGWIYNLIGVNDIGYQINQFNLHNPNNLPGGGYNHNTGGVALYADVTPGPFTLSARYTVSTTQFSNLDLPKNGIADLQANGAPIPTVRGAKPMAASVQGGYGFGYWGKPQYIYLSYQASRQAAGLLLPKTRWAGGYNIEICQNTNLGFEWVRDLDYSAGNGGTAKNTNLVSFRASAKFY